MLRTVFADTTKLCIFQELNLYLVKNKRSNEKLGNVEYTMQV